MIGRREFITRKPFSAARCSLTHLVTSASTLNSGMSIAHVRAVSFSIAESWCGSTLSAFITSLVIGSDRMSSSVSSR